MSLSGQVLHPNPPILALSSDVRRARLVVRGPASLRAPSPYCKFRTFVLELPRDGRIDHELNAKLPLAPAPPLEIQCSWECRARCGRKTRISW